MPVEIRRGSARFTAKVPGRATWHSFSFGEHYDPDRTRFGSMICHDEHLLGNGQGFAEHAHAGIDIVTYVVSGALAHEDSLGNSGVLHAGELGWLRAASGVRHSEIAAAPQTRFVQVWLQEYGGTPAWTRVPVSPGADPTLTLPGGSLHVVHLEAGERTDLPLGALVHAFIASGGLLRHSLAEPLTAGDALLLSDEDARETREIVAAVASTVLVWTVEPSESEGLVITPRR